MPEELASQTRVPCRGGVPPIKGRELQRILQLVPEWKAVDRRGANHPQSLLTSNNVDYHTGEELKNLRAELKTAKDIILARSSRTTGLLRIAACIVAIISGEPGACAGAASVDCNDAGASDLALEFTEGSTGFLGLPVGRPDGFRGIGFLSCDSKTGAGTAIVYRGRYSQKGTLSAPKGTLCTERDA
jgi:hypothetical protein